MKKKIKTLTEMSEILERLRKKDTSTVFVNGCFDLLHVGHTRYLQAAHNLGDILVVGLNGDKSVRKLKGPQRPLMNQQERAAILSALRWVDYIVIFDDLTADKVLRTLRPDFHAKGTDYTKATVPERKTVLEYGGQIAIVGDPKNHSTRQILKQISQEVD